MLISINGLYGSGGNELGFALGEKFGYPVYDGELTAKAVANSNIDMIHSTFAFYDETDKGIDKMISDPYTNALLSLQMDVLPIGNEAREKRTEHRHSGLLSFFMDSMPVNQREGTPIRQKDDIDRLKFAQAKVILDAAEKGNGIFLGRCSSYILGGRPDTLRIFTCASLDSCRERIAGKYKITDVKKANELIKQTNRRRSYYFETFTGQKWDDLENYDLCINTDYLGFDKTLELLCDIVKSKA